jgi:hypothetical protein
MTPDLTIATFVCTLRTGMKLWRMCEIRKQCYVIYEPARIWISYLHGDIIRQQISKMCIVLCIAIF